MRNRTEEMPQDREETHRTERGPTGQRGDSTRQRGTPVTERGPTDRKGTQRQKRDPTEWRSRRKRRSHRTSGAPGRAAPSAVLQAATTRALVSRFTSCLHLPCPRCADGLLPLPCSLDQPGHHPPQALPPAGP